MIELSISEAVISIFVCIFLGYGIANLQNQDKKYEKLLTDFQKHDKLNNESYK